MTRSSYRPLVPRASHTSLDNREMGFDDENTKKFNDYFVDQWLENEEIVNIWCCYGERHRTTNLMEAWNSRFNRKNGKKPAFILCVQNIAEDIKHYEEKQKTTTSPPGEPLVRAPVGKPRCPPAISRLRVEKVEGGLAVAGVVVAANCQILLPIFGFLFMLVGCVLTAASYRGCGENEEPDHYAARIAFTGNSRVLGPVCIVAGALMTIAGIVLCILMRAAQRKQRRLAYNCPIHGDFYPLSPLHTRKYSRSPSGLYRRLRSWLGLVEDGEAPRCPRSAEPASPARADAPCPPPLPFVVPSDSVVCMASVLGAPLSPEQTFGSIKSLAISREVASFPLSRSPTPPPLSCPPFKDDSKNYDDQIPNSISRPEFDCGSPTCNYRVVECKLTTSDEISRSAPLPSVHRHKDHKPVRPNTVSITIPDEKG